jgi:hypothetical protein
MVAVEDVRHFQIERRAYGLLMRRHPRVFDPMPASTVFVFKDPDQAAGQGDSGVNAMLRPRAEI